VNGRTVRAVTVRPGGLPQIVRVEPTLEAICGALDGGQLEAVQGLGWHMYCDEQGELKGLPENIAATALIEAVRPGWMQGNGGPIRGPVIVFGNADDDSEETDVPDKLAATAQKIAVLGTPDPVQLREPGPAGRPLMLAAMVIQRALPLHGFSRERNAIIGCRVGAQVLIKLGYEVEFVSVGVLLASKLAIDSKGQHGHTIGVLGDDAIDAHGPDGGSWNGHLILRVGGKWLLDITAQTFHRPSQGLPVDEPVLWQLPDPDVRLVAGAALVGHRPDGSMWRYGVNDHDGWRRTSAWNRNGRRADAAVESALRLIRSYERASEPDDVAARGLWRCATCRMGAKRVYLPDGTVTFMHARQWEVTDGHPVMPEHVQSLRDVNVKCDFCLDPDPVWIYTGPNLIERAVDRHPLTGEPLDGGVQGLGTEWLGCARCDPYITAEDLHGLARSAIRSKANRASGAGTGPEFLAVFKKANWANWLKFIPNITRRRLIDPPVLDPIDPRKMPKVRARLVRFLDDEGSPAFGEVLRGICLPGPDAGYPDEMMVKVASVTPAQDQAYAARILTGLRRSELYHVSEDFTALAQTSGADLDDVSITPEELPAPHGLIMWATPIMGADARHTPGTDTADICAASWTTVSGLGVWVNWYVRTDQLFPDDAVALAECGWLTPWGNGTGMQFGHKYAAALPPDGDSPSFPAHDPDGLSVHRTLLATWLLINEPGVAEIKEHETTDKKLVKDAQRAKPEPKPPPSVRIVDLRHHERRGPRPEGTGGWTVSVRFPVRGHWRNQAYGPNRSLRKRKYINDFIKGDESLPMKPGARVPIVRVLK
jgi:hypothetical protein